MKSLRCDLEKSTINIGFVCAVILTTMLCFTANVYRDISIDKNYSVYEALLTIDNRIIQNNYDFASISVFKKALTGYISMFLPIIVAFPFMVSFCAERNNGLMRLAISRTGRYRYYFSKFFSSILSGGLAVMLGVAVFGIFVWFLFPSLSSYNLSTEQLNWLIPGGMVITILRMLLAAFLCGVIGALPSFFISSFCKNPYIITCLPFMLNYVRDTALNKAATNYLNAVDYEKYNKLLPFYSNSISKISDYSGLNSVMKTTILVNGISLLIALFGFIIIMNLRFDKGS